MTHICKNGSEIFETLPLKFVCQKDHNFRATSQLDHQCLWNAVTYVGKRRSDVANYTITLADAP